MCLLAYEANRNIFNIIKEPCNVSLQVGDEDLSNDNLALVCAKDASAHPHLPHAHLHLLLHMHMHAGRVLGSIPTHHILVLPIIQFP